MRGAPHFPPCRGAPLQPRDSISQGSQINALPQERSFTASGLRTSQRASGQIEGRRLPLATSSFGLRFPAHSGAAW